MPQCFPTLDLLECFPFTHPSLNFKNFYKCAYDTFHNTLTIKPLTTINEITLTNITCFPVSWISYYHFTNPLSLPLYNNQEDNDLCQSRIDHLATALHEKQFTTIGLTQTLNRFVAQKANQFSINHYDHATARYMEDTF